MRCPQHSTGGRLVIDKADLLLLAVQFAVLPQLGLVDVEERLLRPDHAARSADPDVPDRLHAVRTAVDRWRLLASNGNAHRHDSLLRNLAT